MAAVSSKVKVLTAAAVVALTIGGTATVVYNFAKPKTHTVALRPSASITMSGNGALVGQWWRPRLNQVYGLQAGEMVKHVPKPYIPERSAYFSDVMNDQPHMAGSATSISSSTLFVFDQEPNWKTQQYAVPFTFLSVVRAMTGLRSYDFDGLGDIGSMPLPGDWVIRKGADNSKCLAALQSIVHSEFGKPLQLAPRTVERDVIVARGAMDLQPLPHEFDNCLALYIGTRNGSGVGHTAGSLSDLLGDVGEMLNTKVINETTPPDKQLVWHEYVEPNELKTADQREELLKHISEQSGITFTKERRPVEVWFAQSAKDAKIDTTTAN